VLTDVEGRLSPGSEVLLVSPDGGRQEVRIATVRRRGEQAIIRFDGFESRDDVEHLRSAQLEVDRSRVPEAPQGTYFFFELVGCDCYDVHTGELGRVAGLLEDGGGLILEIEQPDRRLLVPFVKAYLKSVDTSNRRIEMQLPDGLIETCTSES
jgi:16S rRNA processing protein RimM